MPQAVEFGNYCPSANVIPCLGDQEASICQLTGCLFVQHEPVKVLCCHDQLQASPGNLA